MIEVRLVVILVAPADQVELAKAQRREGLVVVRCGVAERHVLCEWIPSHRVGPHASENYRGGPYLDRVWGYSARRAAESGERVGGAAPIVDGTAGASVGSRGAGSFRCLAAGI